MWHAIGGIGRVGVITPTGIATDSFTQAFFQAMVDRCSLVSLYDFENRKGVFPGVHRSHKFSLLTLSGDARPVDEAEFVFFAVDVVDLEDAEKRFTLAPDDFALLNPNTRTCPVFRTRRDAEITKAIHRRVPVLVREGDPNGNPWGFKGQLMFMMNTDSHLFRTREELEAEGFTLEGNHFVRGEDRYLPLYEAKMGGFFDHRAADVVISASAAIRQAQPSALTRREHSDPARVAMPRYWVAETEVNDRTATTGSLLQVRDLTSPTNERSVIPFVSPRVGVGHTSWLVELEASTHEIGLVTAALSSLVLDFVARQKLGGLHLSKFFIQQLPIPLRQPTSDLVARIVLELTYTAWDLAAFAAGLGYQDPPFRWDEERRLVLRAELDALMFRLYGIERDDVDYILDTFPIVKRKDEAAFSEYRTKRLILERYDAMTAAEAAGRSYETILDPPPAHPSQSHPESTRPAWADPPQAP
jgi:hypothetical protein